MHVSTERAKLGRASYTGLAFCSFRVRIDEFPAACRLLKHVLSLLVTCPPSHQFHRLSCVLDFLLVVFLHVNWLSSLNWQKTSCWWWSFFSWCVFLVAYSNDCGWGGLYPIAPFEPNKLLSWCKFSFDFITLHQFDPISYSLYFSNISNQWKIFHFLWPLLKLFRRIPGTSPWRLKYSGASCQWLVLWLVTGSTG